MSPWEQREEEFARVEEANRDAIANINAIMAELADDPETRRAVLADILAELQPEVERARETVLQIAHDPNADCCRSELFPAFAALVEYDSLRS
jgi:hypothetical protein